MPRAYTASRLAGQNRRYRGTGGVSENNREIGFKPAFIDHRTGIIYRSCNPDGSPAPFHRLDGLPAELIDARDPCGKVIAVKGTIEAGFERNGRFYSRDEAAAAVAREKPF